LEVEDNDTNLSAEAQAAQKSAWLSRTHEIAYGAQSDHPQAQKKQKISNRIETA
jgi:hypothetical protein